MTARRLLLLAVLAGCGEGTMVDIDKDDLVGYEDWKRVDVFGEVGGHGDSYRIIYANDIAEDRLEDQDVGEPGKWKPGTVIVKEIYSFEDDTVGDLQYIGVMRRMVLGSEPDGAELFKTFSDADTGWLFTYLGGDIDSDEEFRESCWSECHVAAPYGGAFLDYSQ